MSLWKRLSAILRGVLSMLSCMLRLARDSSSRRTASEEPSLAAKKSGVCPYKEPENTTIKSDEHTHNLTGDGKLEHAVTYECIVYTWIPVLHIAPCLTIC